MPSTSGQPDGGGANHQLGYRAGNLPDYPLSGETYRTARYAAKNQGHNQKLEFKSPKMPEKGTDRGMISKRRLERKNIKLKFPAGEHQRAILRESIFCKKSGRELNSSQQKRHRADIFEGDFCPGGNGPTQLRPVGVKL
jgi:hypothetical protein